MTPEWRMLRVPGGRGLVVVAESAQDAATILSLRDARLGHGAGTFLVDLIDGLLVADVWSAVGVLAGLRVRDALLVDPASREPRSLLADAGVRAYGMLRPEDRSLSAWLRPLDRDLAAIRLGDAIIASTPPPRGLAEEVTAR